MAIFKGNANNAAILLKGIKSPTLQVDKIRLELLNALHKEGRAAVKEHEKTVKTWRGEKPTFVSQVSLAGGNATLLVGPTGDEKGVAKWSWLNEGTKIRWAVMSGDWQSKTTPRSFGSGPGAGRVVIYGKAAMLKRGIGPRPGIEAREWTTEIQKRRKREFQRLMVEAIQRGREKAFASG